MKPKQRTIFPIIIILLLAPIFGELLSGSSPPVEFFQPAIFLLLTFLYGLGALLIRETVRRWENGWLAVLLMGMAYGIFEEGIMVRSFFDPRWGDLGLLASYGRWIGINWIWSIALTIFHAVVSISLPIALTELILPKYKRTLWLTKKGYTITLVLFSLNTFIGLFIGMNITVLGFAAAIICIILLILLANTWTEKEIISKKPGPRWKIILAGFSLMVGLIAGMWIFPALSIPWLLTFIYLCILPWFGFRWFKRLGMQVWMELDSWSAIFGFMLPWLILGIFSELDKANRPDDTSGMILTAVCFFFLMLLLRYVLRKRELKQSDSIQVI